MWCWRGDAAASGCAQRGFRAGWVAAGDICSTFGILPESPGGSSDIPGRPQLCHVLLTTAYPLLLMSWVRPACNTGGRGRINTLLVGVLIPLRVNSVEKLCVCLPVGGTRRIPSPQAIPSLAVSNSLPAPEYIFHFHNFLQFAF